MPVRTVLSEEKVAETLRRVHEEVPELQLIRRVRRPLRIILWGTFYALMLLACVALAAVLYKALRGH